MGRALARQRLKAKSAPTGSVAGQSFSPGALTPPDAQGLLTSCTPGAGTFPVGRAARGAARGVRSLASMDSDTPTTIRLFSTDLDGTLLGNPESGQRLSEAWQSLAPEDRPLLVYNSGRLVDDMQRLVGRGKLPRPDYYIGGVGTQIVDAHSGHGLDEFLAELDRGWDLERISEVLTRFPKLERQPEHFQNPHKTSWFLKD